MSLQETQDHIAEAKKRLIAVASLSNANPRLKAALMTAAAHIDDHSYVSNGQARALKRLASL